MKDTNKHIDSTINTYTSPDRCFKSGSLVENKTSLVPSKSLETSHTNSPLPLKDPIIVSTYSKNQDSIKSHFQTTTNINSSVVAPNHAKKQLKPIELVHTSKEE